MRDSGLPTDNLSFWCCCLLAVFALLLASFSFGDYNAYALKGSELDSQLWLPDRLLPHENYKGLIVVENNIKKPITFEIVTDNNDVINIKTKRVTIENGTHHGILEFETKGTGDAEIFAVFKERLLNDRVDVEESATVPSELDLILPSNLVNVLARESQATGYVFLENEFDDPIPAMQPIEVVLTSNGDIKLQSRVITIEQGKHYAKFEFNTRGEGKITVSAQGIEPDDESISVTEPEEITLNLEVVPEPVPTSDSALIYYWLERGGEPYLAPHDISVKLSIDKSENLSFNAAMRGAIVLSEKSSGGEGEDGPAEAESSGDRRSESKNAKEIITRTDAQLEEDSTKNVYLKKGEYFGKIKVYSSFDSEGNIRISGLAKSIDADIEEERVQESDIITTGTEKSETGTLEETEIFALPDPAYDKVDIIVSARSDNAPLIEEDDEDFVVFTDNKLDPSSISGKIETDRNYAVVTARVLDLGSSEIFGQIKETDSDEITVELVENWVRDPDLEVVDLPVVFGVNQDLFVISSTHERITTNPHSKEERELVSITSKPPFPYEAKKEGESILSVIGTVDQISEDDPEVFVASNADTVTQTIDVYNPNQKDIEILHPDTVFKGEPFPIVQYITDSDGNLLQKSELRVSSNTEMTRQGEFAVLNETGKQDLVFYANNASPTESTVTVSGPSQDKEPKKSPQKSSSKEQSKKKREEIRKRYFTYDVTVEGEGTEGSGTYRRGEEAEISAPPVKDDFFVYKKKFDHWENLGFREPETSFRVDEDVTTKPVYKPDYTMMVTMAAPAAGLGGILFVKKRLKDKQKAKEDSESEEYFADDEQEDLGIDEDLDLGSLDTGEK